MGFFIYFQIGIKRKGIMQDFIALYKYFFKGLT